MKSKGRSKTRSVSLEWRGTKKGRKERKVCSFGKMKSLKALRNGEAWAYIAVEMEKADGAKGQLILDIICVLSGTREGRINSEI